MSVCEKCWRDAGRRAVSNPHKSKSEHYLDILEERKDNPCTEDQQKADWLVEKAEDTVDMRKHHPGDFDDHPSNEQMEYFKRGGR